MEETREIKPAKLSQQAAASDEVVNRTLAAYVEVCCGLGTPQRGLNAVYFQRTRYYRSSSKHVRPVKDIRVYNTLLRGFAAKADFNKVREVLKIMQDEETVLDVYSYAAILECLGRINVDNNHLKYIRIYVKEAKRQGITFDRIMNDAVFGKEQREVILKAMRAFDNQYKPQYELHNLQYNNQLLSSLNVAKEELQLPENVDTPKNGIFKTVNWSDVVEKQMKLETDGFITVSALKIDFFFFYI